MRPGPEPPISRSLWLGRGPCRPTWLKRVSLSIAWWPRDTVRISRSGPIPRRPAGHRIGASNSPSSHSSSDHADRDPKNPVRIVLSTRTLASAVVLATTATPLHAQAIPTPESVLGFVPGTDRKLADWPTTLTYYQRLSAASNRVRYRELGKTTNGAPFVVLTISSPANLARLDEIRADNAKLADPRRLTSPAERARIIRDGKMIVLITSGIHSDE